MKKSDLSMLIWGFYKNPYKSTYIIYQLKKEDLVLEAQINFPYENFPDMPVEKKKGPDPHYYSQNSTSHTIIHRTQQVLEEKEKQSMTCDKTIKKPNSSNFHDPLKEDQKVQQIHTTYIPQMGKIVHK